MFKFNRQLALALTAVAALGITAIAATGAPGVGEAFARMMSGHAQFRVVLTM